MNLPVASTLGESRNLQSDAPTGGRRKSHPMVSSELPEIITVCDRIAVFWKDD